MKLSTLSLALPILFITALPQTAFACSCMGYADPEQGYKASFDYATMVFMGTVSETSTKPGTTEHSATFSVEKTWKGHPEAFIQVYTYGDSAGCGFEFTEGMAYVVFSQPDSKGGATTTLCSGTTNAKDPAGAKLIEWLNSYDSSGSSSSAPWSCEPYICANGDEHPSCTEDGHQINYFVAPCQFSGGDASIGSSSSASSSSVQTFTDVPSTHVNVTAITFVKERGIVSGYPDGSFGPDKRINRAEFTKIVIGATFGPEYIEGCDLTSLFSDIVPSDWFWSFVCQAKRAGVIGGYPDGTFRPAQNVNFAEAAKIVVNAFNIEIKEEEALGVWWRPYVYALARIGGLPPTFSDPNQLVTRGEMAEMISRVMNGLEQ